MKRVIDVCLAGNPAVNGKCGDQDCVCDTLVFTLAEAVEAIEARVSGVWDNKQLKRIGELSTNIKTDIAYIINHLETEHDL